MSDGEVPTLEVGFAITPEFDALRQVENAMSTTEGRIVAEAARIEKATSGMVRLGGATAQITSFSNAATRELANSAREMARAEKSGEGLSRQLERQIGVFGKSREELRHMKVETAALAAEQQGLSELATRLRAQEAALYDQEYAVMRRAKAEAEAVAEEKAMAAQRAVAAAEQEAKAVREAAWAHQMFEARVRAGAQALREQEAAEKATSREAATAQLRTETTAVNQLAQEKARLATIVRASHDAQVADAEAAERLRMATDPLYSATKRLNEELAESTRLYHAGVTAQGEYARQQEVLTGRLRTLQAGHDQTAKSAGRSSGTLTQLSFQINDVATMAAMGAPPLQIFASQAGQILQVAQQAEGGVKGFSKEIGGLTLRFLPLVAVAAVAGVAFARWKDQINDEAGTKKFVDGLGLTEKELKKLGDTSVTTGDMMSGLWRTVSDGLSLDGMGKKIIDYLFSPNDAQQVGNFVAEVYGLFVGGYRAIVDVWNLFPAAMGDLFVKATNAAIVSIQALVNGAIEAVNNFAQRANTVLKWAGFDGVFGQLDTVKIKPLANQYDGALSQMGDATKHFSAATGEAKSAMSGFFATWGGNAQKARNERLKAKADELKSTRTPKSDHHADKLARDAAAIEAQIRNLYAVADAYRVSGAAALVAEARVKAESAAIKQRGDIEAAVNRQVQLSIAQRVADGAKSAAATREQAIAQEQVNAMVAAGLVTSERAAELVQGRIADLPLLAAIEVAQQRGLKEEAERATKALEDQQAVRERARAARATEQFNSSTASGNDRLALLREELRLIGATDMERAKALATVKATQEAEKLNAGDRATYIAQQVQIAEQQQKLTDAQREFNDALTFTANQWDLIASNVQNGAQGMADAFGRVGDAIGSMASIYAGFRADQERADVEHAARLRAATSEEAKAREMARHHLATSTAQVGAYGDMASAAKGFFHEGSSGYKALETAEKAFRAVEFALSVRAMAQDAVETASSIAKSGMRTATKAVEAVVSAISSLPFPLNLAAGAATIAALASIGVGIAGSFGGGGDHQPKSNTGTGTVLGDSSAKSESIKRSIDALKEVDTLMLSYSRQMAASLSSIESQIGGFASLLVRQGDKINASGGITDNFKMNAVGSVLSKIPIIGGILGGLFGTKTTIKQTGLYGGAQSIEDILNGGYDASYYSVINRRKKAFGVTYSNRTQTKYQDADPMLENQFTLILRQFNDAIAAAAGPLGKSTAEIQARLNSFVLDIGKIDLQGLTGAEIEEKLNAVFGAAADNMANAAFPGMQRFQQVGEGLFETLIRVASTVESVSSSFDLLGFATTGLSIDMKMAIADQFDSIGDMSSAVQGYFEAFYTKQEQAAAKTAQFAKVFDSLGLTMPGTLAGFRALVEAQDLTTAAGQATYATLLQLAPAFADLQASMNGAKSAADILSERQDLERKMLELKGDTAALRALDLAQLDASNRALQQQIWAVQDAKEAAQAAEQLRDAWASVGDGIMDEVKRIRGVMGGNEEGSYAALLGQFNAATAAARGGDQDMAKSLPGLSQALLRAAALSATSQQELQRVQAQTAASLEATYGAINVLTGGTSASPASTLAAAATASQNASAPSAANDDLVSELQALRSEVAQMRTENNAGLAATAGNTGKIARKLDDVTSASGGEAISVAGVAA